MLHARREAEGDSTMLAGEALERSRLEEVQLEEEERSIEEGEQLERWRQKREEAASASAAAAADAGEGLQSTAWAAPASSDVERAEEERPSEAPPTRVFEVESRRRLTKLANRETRARTTWAPSNCCWNPPRRFEVLREKRVSSSPRKRTNHHSPGPRPCCCCC